SAGHEETVRELVGSGADVRKTTDKGLTPLTVKRSFRLAHTYIHLISPRSINARDKANQLPLHRAATTGSTGSTGFIALLLEPREGIKPRLNTGDRLGNTPLHLAMESGHAAAAVQLIEAGADRSRTNLEGLMPEQLEGVGGQEQQRVKNYVIDHCGEPPA
ncbi:ankyrin, partial [Coniophora puteana RWD-64-598 SS2]